MSNNEYHHDKLDLPKDISRVSCELCGNKKVTRESFKDGASWQEFQASGLCQKCQDEFIEDRLVARRK